MNRKYIGKIGENKAVEWLTARGFMVQERNIFWCKHEIDILATKDGMTYLFEVKTVNSLAFVKVSNSQKIAYETYMLKFLSNVPVQCYVLIVHDEVHMIPMELE